MSKNESQQNQLLAALPNYEFQRLIPHLQTVKLTVGEILDQPYETIEYVYFPHQGMISLVAIMENGTTTEVAIVGKEGVIGISTLLGSDCSIHCAMVQIAGNASRIKVDLLKQEFNRGSRLQKLLLLYTQARLTQITQNAACYSQHLIEQRLARWLLTVHDCVQQDNFSLTQEIIAAMLGVRRSGITKAANLLQKAEIISYSRGNITILNRAALESASCECYWIIQQEFQRLFRFNV
ncbi:putative transcriptional regulator, Crp/Fnr family [Stanieria cyanosphaera PCC 7437]|uniref:Transcriptional regulator, Crp/Fnr family n=1 Tax=Stanieria cyanosphaera (strain ATCC 29371 / PCC 7437) TaxID=111780 RepID=K9XP71_STAC7|nr:Crp/Fnr family transcriptional regulator [Stanieria cyanosphaera]AFZ34410.1 putative transcriptional regulator, Crp/Fnr family [Stanieria cyanosphaera PCC 7437]